MSQEDRWQSDLELILGVEFNDVALFRRACTHSSFWEGKAPGPDSDFERLEFLGDAILGMILALDLFHTHRDSGPGELTKRRSGFASREAHAAAARHLELGRFVRLGKGEEESGGRDKANILGCVFEALCGALYLDRGEAEGLAAVVSFARPALQAVAHSLPPGGERARSRLNEWAQHNPGRLEKIAATFDGPDHMRVWTTGFSLDGQHFVATAAKTKDAEELAARQVMAWLDAG